MKKLAIAAGILFLTGIVAYPAFARGPGWCGGYGYGSWGDRAGGPGYCWKDRGYGAATPGQSGKLAELDTKFAAETEQMREDIWAKSSELDAVLDSPNPDLEKAKALQKEINDLRAGMADKRLEYEVEARKLGSVERYSRGYGMGYGMGYGYGRGNRGYGRGGGACWY